MPSAGDTGAQWPATAALYASKHNPFILYNDIRLNPERAARIKPYTDLAADLNSWNVPDFDGANPVAGCCDSPLLPAGDPNVNPAWPGGVFGGGPVPMIVISSSGPRHATYAAPANHYSMLLTIEEGFGLDKLGYTSDSAQVHPLWPLIGG